MEEQIFNSEALNKNTAIRMFDVALQSLQKGVVVAALTAMAPIGTVMLEKGNEDKELDALADNFSHATRFLVSVTNGISVNRRVAQTVHRPYLRQSHWAICVWWFCVF